jgi:hypothetical protein
MPELMTGVVSRVGSRGTSFQLDGASDWYSAFNPEQLSGTSEGDNVSFTYAEKADKHDATKIYKNIRGNVTVVAKSPDPQPTKVALKASAKRGEPVLTRERLILRQNALTNAVSFCKSESTLEDVLRTASIFEAYTSGDGDVPQAADSTGNDPTLEYAKAFEGLRSA